MHRRDGHQAREHALFRGFEHGGVAGDERRAERARRQRHREVERRDDGPDAVGAHDVARCFAFDEAAHGHGEPVVRLHLVAVVADEVGRLLDVAERLEPVLADLHRHQRRELAAVLGDLVGGPLEDRDPLLPRRRRPRGRGFARRAHRVVHVVVGRVREPADEQVAICG